MFLREAALRSPPSACCVYQCLRRDRGYCTVSLLWIGCVRAEHCTVALPPRAPGPPRKPGWCSRPLDISERNSHLKHSCLRGYRRLGWDAQLLGRIRKIPRCDRARSLLGLLSSIYQCHSGSHGITVSVSISVCQLVSLIGIYVCEAYTF